MQNHCGIAKLHDDTLHELFLFVYEVDPIYQPDLGTKLGWISLTHVCHRWRKIVLKMSRLWAENIFSFKNYRIPTLFIYRAQNFPLTFDIDLTPPSHLWDEDCLEICLELIHLAESICVESIPLEDCPSVFQDRELPKLRYLVVGQELSSKGCRQVNIDAVNLKTVILRGLFPTFRNSASLSTLKLFGI